VRAPRLEQQAVALLHLKPLVVDPELQPALEHEHELLIRVV
jgi:hypothetical protein